MSEKTRGQKGEERWGSEKGGACSCVKSAHCSFKISYFFFPALCRCIDAHHCPESLFCSSEVELKSTD